MTNKLVNEYDEEPVYFCTECLSLAATKMTIPMGNGIEELYYCPYCGSISFKKCNITIWEEKVEDKYGENFLNSNKTWKELMETKLKEKL